MANPPVRGSGAKPKHSWMCPNHVEHELAALDSSVMTSSRLQILKGNGRTHKVRRPKNAKIVDTALRRGFVNNGLVEIENEASDDEAFFEREQLGVVYRLPERGVKLDFIDRVKRCGQVLCADFAVYTNSMIDPGWNHNPSFIPLFPAQSSRSSALPHRLKRRRKTFRSDRLSSAKLH